MPIPFFCPQCAGPLVSGGRCAACMLAWRFAPVPIPVYHRRAALDELSLVRARLGAAAGYPAPSGGLVLRYPALPLPPLARILMLLINATDTDPDEQESIA